MWKKKKSENKHYVISHEITDLGKCYIQAYVW